MECAVLGDFLDVTQQAINQLIRTQKCEKSVDFDAPISIIWPDLPDHNEELLDGKKGAELGKAMSDGTPENEHYWRDAVTFALDAVDDVVDKLCKCCDEVTITIDIQDDPDIMNGVKTANAKLGTSYKAGINTKVYKCP